MRREKICFVTTVPFSINMFLRPHVEALRQHYDITLVSNGASGEIDGGLKEGVVFVRVGIQRKIALFSDVTVLVSLWRLFRREKFDIVHSITPKAGLLAMVAANGARVPLRFHTFTGQVWMTRRGPMRWLLKALDGMIVRNATMALADSPSQRSFLVDAGVASPESLRVLADGSICGVDVDRFAFSANARDRVRTMLGIPSDAVVFLFLGRLTREKGIGDLVQAFGAVGAEYSAAHLIVAGPDEERLGDEIAELGRRFPGRVHLEGMTPRPEDFMSASDILCLPSYREGFGNVVIEAAAAGVPAVASRIYGVTDAAADGVTAILYDPRSVPALGAAMRRLLSDSELRRRMGAAALERALERFSEGRVTGALLDFYRASLADPASVQQ